MSSIDNSGLPPQMSIHRVSVRLPGGPEGETVWSTAGDHDLLLAIDGRIALFSSVEILLSHVSNDQSSNLAEQGAYVAFRDDLPASEYLLFRDVGCFDLAASVEILGHDVSTWTVDEREVLLEALNGLWDISMTLGDDFVAGLLRAGGGVLADLTDHLTLTSYPFGVTGSLDAFQDSALARGALFDCLRSVRPGFTVI